jgi:hypothetical protein
MKNIEQYNFYLNFKQEINNMKYPDLIILLIKYKIKFNKKILNMFFEIIDKSNHKIYQKQFMKNIISIQLFKKSCDKNQLFKSV